MKAIHTMTRWLPLTGIVAGLLAACASAGPSVHLHTLMPAELPARSAAASAAATPLLLDLRLPPQVEQPQLLVRVADGSLMSLEQERWASPLRDELRLALFEELGARFGIVEARNAAAPAPGPARVAIDIRRFDSVAGVEARVEGAWTIAASASASASASSPGNVPAQRCEWLYRESAGGAVASLPDAHRRIVVRLADGIGSAVAASKSGSAIACPASDLR